jgi:hypothetical protein
VDADPTAVRGRPKRMGKQPTFAPISVRRGNRHGTLERWCG